MASSDKQYDVVIIGGGPAGLTAALYTARRNLSTVIISKDLGGQAATTSVIENYPGVGAIDGFELMKKFRDQAVSSGAEFKLGEVHKITQQAEDKFIVDYNTEQIETRSIILAFGLTPRSLNVPGEAELVGKGVTYSAAAVVDTLRGKTVAVIGGGNSAIESVNVLAAVAKQVYLVHRRDKFRAEAVLLETMAQCKNVTQVLNAQLKQIAGENNVTGIVVQQEGKAERTIVVDAVCINAGFMSKTNFLDGLVDMSEKHEVIVTADCRTSKTGIFAAGDVTTSNCKQVVVSAGEGCKAALACYTYLGTKDGKNVSVNQDWKVSSNEHFIRS
ncbi:MAG: FAD-dependent oxidoreductase [Patescibacteria group bacterium]|jgi:thioredoxin reductase (NADPH)